PLDVAARARAEATALDRELAVSAARLLEQVAADATAPQRFASVLLASFAALALLLAAAGVYAVLSVSVEQRRRELGIRMALGAQRSDVLKLVLSDSLGLALPGLILGGLAAAASVRTLSALLHGVSAADPWTAASSALALLVVALLASALPAWRGARV